MSVRYEADGPIVVITLDRPEVANAIDRPTSLDFIGNTAFVVTLTGEVWRIDNVSGPPFGVSH